MRWATAGSNANQVQPSRPAENLELKSTTPNSSLPHSDSSILRKKPPFFVCSTADYFSQPGNQVDLTWRRTSGCETPYTGLFLLHWIFYIFLVLETFATLPRFLPFPSLAILLPLALLQLVCTFLTVFIDAEDRTCHEARKSGHPRNTDFIKKPGYAVIDASGHCGICDVVVQSGTKHCKQCNKCVSGFDHHCGYLNVCVGARNYHLFVTTSILGAILLTAIVVLSGWVIGIYFKNRESFNETVRGMLGKDVPGMQETIATFVFLNLLIATLMAAAVYSLLAFHLKLVILNLTTYQYHEACEDADVQGSSKDHLSATKKSKSKAPASVVESVVFLEAVKRSGGAVLHAAFVRLLGRFRNGELGTGDVVGEVKTLFAGRPDLVRGFAVFLPDGYEGELLLEKEVAIKKYPAIPSLSFTPPTPPTPPLVAPPAEPVSVSPFAPLFNADDVSDSSESDTEGELKIPPTPTSTTLVFNNSASHNGEDQETDTDTEKELPFSPTENDDVPFRLRPFLQRSSSIQQTDTTECVDSTPYSDEHALQQSILSPPPLNEVQPVSPLLGYEADASSESESDESDNEQEALTGQNFVIENDRNLLEFLLDAEAELNRNLKPTRIESIPSNVSAPSAPQTDIQLDAIVNPIQQYDRSLLEFLLDAEKELKRVSEPSEPIQSIPRTNTTTQTYASSLLTESPIRSLDIAPSITSSNEAYVQASCETSHAAVQSNTSKVSDSMSQTIELLPALVSDAAIQTETLDSSLVLETSNCIAEALPIVDQPIDAIKSEEFLESAVPVKDYKSIKCFTEPSTHSPSIPVSSTYIISLCLSIIVCSTSTVFGYWVLQFHAQRPAVFTTIGESLSSFDSCFAHSSNSV
ncbi:hypothetical protein HDU79_002963 [Rhizoclosmatium sp. JEL0117]|nr:hypothetical protein HDU79_002963 [Rhizoclosmatium sp. JEL0117]